MNIAIKTNLATQMAGNDIFVANSDQATIRITPEIVKYNFCPNLSAKIPAGIANIIFPSRFDELIHDHSVAENWASLETVKR